MRFAIGSHIIPPDGGANDGQFFTDPPSVSLKAHRSNAADPRP